MSKRRTFPGLRDTNGGLIVFKNHRLNRMGNGHDEAHILRISLSVISSAFSTPRIPFSFAFMLQLRIGCDDNLVLRMGTESVVAKTILPSSRQY